MQPVPVESEPFAEDENTDPNRQSGSPTLTNHTALTGNPPDDDKTTSDLLTMRERASHVLSMGHVKLDTSMKVFLVRGSTEPRVVRLFPTKTCSCPIRSGCYHILAAEMAVGMDTEPHRRRLNLTQLRCNKRKKADKTSGRKRPRADDVDVVAAEDAEPDIATELEAAVMGDDAPNSCPSVVQVVAEVHAPESEFEEPHTQEPTQTGAPDNCAECGCMEPPASALKRRKVVHWVQCDECHFWYHICCTQLRGKPKRREQFHCVRCEH